MNGLCYLNSENIRQVYAHLGGGSIAFKGWILMDFGGKKRAVKML